MDKRIGAQLYTVREFCQNEADFEATIKKLNEIGYKVVQVSGVGDIAPEKIKKICHKYGVTIACTHKSLADYTERIEDMIDFHKALGTNVAGLGSAYDEGLAELENVNKLIDTLNTVTAKLAEHGITFAYHNHAFEFVKVGGKTIMEHMIENGNFDFIVDVYWLAYAGINPADFIKKLGRRCRMIHYKDLAMSIKNTSEYAEVGNGNLDWDAIIAVSDNAEFALVEQDECHGNPIDSMKISYEFLSKKGFS